MLIYPKHDDGTTDSRYSAEYEFLGYYVEKRGVRFCGAFLGACSTDKEASKLMQSHKDKHNQQLSN